VPLTTRFDNKADDTNDQVIVSTMVDRLRNPTRKRKKKKVNPSAWKQSKKARVTKGRTHKSPGHAIQASNSQNDRVGLVVGIGVGGGAHGTGIGLGGVGSRPAFLEDKAAALILMY
jgi:hypothetical protein